MVVYRGSETHLQVAENNLWIKMCIYVKTKEIIQLLKCFNMFIICGDIKEKFYEYVSTILNIPIRRDINTITKCPNKKRR